MPDLKNVIKGLESLHTRLLDMAMQDSIIMLDVSMVANAIDLLKEQEQEISFLKAMQLQTVKGMDEQELGNIVGKTLGLMR